MADGIVELALEIPADAITKYKERIPEANREGLKRVALAAQQIAERKVNAIRRRKVPTNREVATYRRAHKQYKTKAPTRPITANDKPAWNPTGALAEAVEAAPVFETPESVSLNALVDHAEHRHELGVSWTPLEPALGVIRKDPFFAETKEIVAPQVPDLYADGWNRVMER